MSYDNGNTISGLGPGFRAIRHAPAGGQPVTRKPVTVTSRTKWCERCGHKIGARVLPCRCER